MDSIGKNPVLVGTIYVLSGAVSVAVKYSTFVVILVLRTTLVSVVYSVNVVEKTSVTALSVIVAVT